MCKLGGKVECFSDKKGEKEGDRERSARERTSEGGEIRERRREREKRERRGREREKERRRRAATGEWLAGRRWVRKKGTKE